MNDRRFYGRTRAMIARRAVVLVLVSFCVSAILVWIISSLVMRGTLNLEWVTLVGIHSGNLRAGLDLLAVAVITIVLAAAFSGANTWRASALVAFGVSASTEALVIAVLYAPFPFAKAGVAVSHAVIQGLSFLAIVAALAVTLAALGSRDRRA